MTDRQQKSKNRSVSPPERQSTIKSPRHNSPSDPEPTEERKKSPCPERYASPKGNRSPAQSSSKNPRHSPYPLQTEGRKTPSPGRSVFPKESQSPARSSSKSPYHITTSSNSLECVQEAVEPSTIKECNSPPKECKSLSQSPRQVTPTLEPSELPQEPKKNHHESERSTSSKCRRSPSPRKYGSPGQSPRRSPLCPLSPKEGSKRTPSRENTLSPKDHRSSQSWPIPTSPFRLEGTPVGDQRPSSGPDGHGSSQESGKRKLGGIVEEGRIPKRQQRLSQSPQPGSPLSPQRGTSSVLGQLETSTSDVHCPDQSQSDVTEVNSLPPSPGHPQPSERPTEVVPDQDPSGGQGSDLEPWEIPESSGTEETPQELLFACAARFRGHYNAEKNKLTVTLTSSTMAESFYGDIRSDAFLNRLELSLAWDWTEKDLASFSNTIIQTNITQFVLDGKGQLTENQQLLNRGMYGQYGMIFGGGYTTPPRVDEEVGSAGFGTRFNPLIRLLGHTTVTKFHVMGMPEFLKEFSCDLPKDLTHLKILQVDLNISDWDGIHAQRFSDLIKQSTSLNCLVLGCPPEKYHAHLDHAREALVATPTPRTYPIQIQLFSNGTTHVSTDFNQNKEMFRMCVHLARSECYDVYWVPILESTLTHQLRELRLDCLVYETDHWAKALLCWLKGRWSNERNQLEVLRLNWSTVHVDAVLMLKFMFDLVEEHGPNVKLSGPCVQALRVGYETSLAAYNATQEPMRRQKEAMRIAEA